jgi:hypothetical protein
MVRRGDESPTLQNDQRVSSVKPDHLSLNCNGLSNRTSGVGNALDERKSRPQLRNALAKIASQVSRFARCLVLHIVVLVFGIVGLRNC